MVKALNKRIKKMFVEGKGFYIGFSLLIILSVGLLLGFSTASLSIKRSVDEDRLNNNLEDAYFDYDYTVSEQDISYYEDKYNLILQKSVYKDIEIDEAILRIRPPYEKINIHSIVEGDNLNGEGSIVIDRFYMEKHNLEIGDTITVHNKNFTIAGIVSTPDYLDILRNNMDYIANGNKFGIAVVSQNDYLNINEESEYIYTVKFNGNNSEDFVAELNQKGVVRNFTYVENNIRIKPFDGEIVAMMAITKIAPISILLVCMLIMAVVMSRQLKKEYVYIGTLKALGYKPREILLHYLFLPFIVTVVSCIIGIILGYFLAKPLLIMSKAEYSIPKITMRYSAFNFLLSFFLPLILTLFGAFISVRKAVNMNTVSLLKTGSNRKKNSLLLKLAPKQRFSFKFRYKLKETLSNIPRSFLMVFGVTIAGAFMLSGFITNTSIDNLMLNSFDNVFSYEYQYILKTPMLRDLDNGEKQTLKELIYQDDNRSYSVIIYGVEKDTQFINIIDKDGNKIDVGNSTVLTNSVAERLNLNKGDTIMLKDANNLKSYQVTVDEIADINATNFIYMSRENLNKMLNYPMDAYTGILSGEELDIDDNFVYTKHSLSMNKENLIESISLFKKILYFLTVIAGIIGTVVVYVVAVMLIEENSKNISMLMVMGYQPKEINSILINSSTVLVIMGFVLSVPLALLLMDKFLHAITVNMFFVFNTAISFLQLLICFLFFISVYYFSMLGVKRKVNKINLSECLKVVE